MLSAILLAVLPLALAVDFGSFDTNILDSDQLHVCLSSSNCKFNDRVWSFVNNTGVPDDFGDDRVWTRLFDYEDASRFEACKGFQRFNFFVPDSDSCIACQPDYVYLLRLQKYVRSGEGKVEDVVFLDKAFIPTTTSWANYCSQGGDRTVPALSTSLLKTDKSRSFYRYFASSTCYSDNYCYQASSLAPLETKVVCKPNAVENFPSGQFCKYVTGYDNIHVSLEMGCAGTDACESIRFRLHDADFRKSQNTKLMAKAVHSSKRGVNVDELLCVYAESDFEWTWS